MLVEWRFTTREESLSDKSNTVRYIPHVIYRLDPLVRQTPGPKTGGSNLYTTRKGMRPYLDHILDHIKMFLSIIIIWLSSSRDGHIALKGFINKFLASNLKCSSLYKTLSPLIYQTIDTERVPFNLTTTNLSQVLHMVTTSGLLRSLPDWREELTRRPTRAARQPSR